MIRCFLHGRGTRVGQTLGVLLLAAVVLGAPRHVVAQAEVAGEPAPAEEHAVDEHAAEEEHGTALETFARLVNFAVLAGVLVTLLRTPLASYLSDRGGQIRGDLARARITSADAARQLEDIDRKLQALPGELEGLKAQGGREVAAEEARLQQLTQSERQRLLEQTRREIDLQLRVAKRELVDEAARLAVQAATTRIQTSVTEVDQIRLVDRYLDQVGPK